MRSIACVLRGIDAQSGCLRAEQRSNRADDPQSCQHRDDHGGRPPQTQALQRVHHRRENKRQHQGERDRDQDALPEVERRYGDCSDRERVNLAENGDVRRK